MSRYTVSEHRHGEATVGLSGDVGAIDANAVVELVQSFVNPVRNQRVFVGPFHVEAAVAGHSVHGNIPRAKLGTVSDRDRA